eukprot:jgi/Psemu1/7327/gm1.7327_g
MPDFDIHLVDNHPPSCKWDRMEGHFGRIFTQCSYFFCPIEIGAQAPGMPENLRSNSGATRLENEAIMSTSQTKFLSKAAVTYGAVHRVKHHMSHPTKTTQLCVYFGLLLCHHQGGHSSPFLVCCLL